ncbi:DNA gyrase subunit B [Citrobacter sedlakii]|uniref:COG4648 family protein n=1 Tax=Citrobacter sedlakii TaxID=67826 RepID=UPI003B23EA1A
MSGARALPGVKLLTGMLLLAWPFLIWFGLAHNSLRWLLPLMALLLFLRFRQTRRQAGPLRVVTQVVAVAGIVLCVGSALLKTHQLLLFYPVVVNSVMLAVFGGSLWTSMPLVERLARLRDPQLPDAAVRYTRRVTQIWCVFFILNGSIALFTAIYGDMTLWTAWNGMIAYLLMGALMAGEWLVRRQMIKRDPR